MNETSNTQTGGATDGASSGAGAAVSGETKPDPAAAAAAGPAAPAKPDRRSKGAIAAERAQARLTAAKDGNKNKPTATTVAQQAPGGENSAGVSTEAALGSEGKAKPDATADGEKKPAKAGDAAPDSTVTPQDWPTEDRETFEKIPEDGKKLVLSMHKRMHAGFTYAMTQLAEEKDKHQDLVTLDTQFQADPKSVIGELAKRAKLEIFFERPLPEGEIPDEVLKDPKKYAEYIAAEALKGAQRLFDDQTSKRDKETRTTQAREQLGREFKDAAAAHADFESHRPAIVKALQRSPSLSVEEAYRLTTYDALGKLVGEGEKAKRELGKLVADAERAKKEATRLTAGDGAGASANNAADKLKSTGARAYERAAKKLAAGGNRRVTT